MDEKTTAPSQGRGPAESSGSSEGSVHGCGSSDSRAHGSISSADHTHGSISSDGQPAGSISSEGHLPGSISSDGQPHGSISSDGHTHGSSSGDGHPHGSSSSDVHTPGSIISDGHPPGSISSDGHHHSSSSSDGHPHGSSTSEVRTHAFTSSDGHTHGSSSDGHPHGSISSDSHPHGSTSSDGHPHGSTSSDGHPHGSISSGPHPHVSVGRDVHTPGSISSEGHSHGSVSRDVHTTRSISSDGHSHVSISSDGHSHGSISIDIHNTRSISSDGHSHGSFSRDVHTTRSISSDGHLHGSMSRDVHTTRSISSDDHPHGSISRDVHTTRSISSDVRTHGSISSDGRPHGSTGRDVHTPRSISSDVRTHGSSSSDGKGQGSSSSDGRPHGSSGIDSHGQRSTDGRAQGRGNDAEAYLQLLNSFKTPAVPPPPAQEKGKVKKRSSSSDKGKERKARRGAEMPSSSSIEHGLRTDPRLALNSLEACAAMYGVSPEALMGMVDLRPAAAAMAMYGGMMPPMMSPLGVPAAMWPYPYAATMMRGNPGQTTTGAVTAGPSSSSPSGTSKEKKGGNVHPAFGSTVPLMGGMPLGMMDAKSTLAAWAAMQQHVPGQPELFQTPTTHNLPDHKGKVKRAQTPNTGKFSRQDRTSSAQSAPQILSIPRPNLPAPSQSVSPTLVQQPMRQHGDPTMASGSNPIPRTLALGPTSSTSGRPTSVKVAPTGNKRKLGKLDMVLQRLTSRASTGQPAGDCPDGGSVSAMDLSTTPSRHKGDTAADWTGDAQSTTQKGMMRADEPMDLSVPMDLSMGAKPATKDSGPSTDKRIECGPAPAVLGMSTVSGQEPELVLSNKVTLSRGCKRTVDSKGYAEPERREVSVQQQSPSKMTCAVPVIPSTPALDITLGLPSIIKTLQEKALKEIDTHHLSKSKNLQCGVSVKEDCSLMSRTQLSPSKDTTVPTEEPQKDEAKSMDQAVQNRKDSVPESILESVPVPDILAEPSKQLDLEAIPTGELPKGSELGVSCEENENEQCNKGTISEPLPSQSPSHLEQVATSVAGDSEGCSKTRPDHKENSAVDGATEQATDFCNTTRLENNKESGSSVVATSNDHTGSDKIESMLDTVYEPPEGSPQIEDKSVKEEPMEGSELEQDCERGKVIGEVIFPMKVETEYMETEEHDPYLSSGKSVLVIKGDLGKKAVNEEQLMEVSLSETQTKQSVVPQSEVLNTSMCEEQSSNVLVSEEQLVKALVTEAKTLELSVCQEESMKASVSEEQSVESSLKERSSLQESPASGVKLVEPSACGVQSEKTAVSVGQSNTPSVIGGIPSINFVTAGKSITPSMAAEQSTIPSKACGLSNTPSVTGGVRNTPFVTAGKSTTPPMAAGQSIIPSMTGGLSNTPSVTGGLPNTHFVTAEKSSTPSMAAGQSTTPSLTGRPSNTPSITDGLPVTPSMTPGHSNIPSVTAGEPSIPSVTAAQSNTPSVTAGQSNTPSVTAGQSNTPSITAGQSNTSSVTVGQSKTPSVTAGQSTTPSVTGGQSNTPSITARQSKILSVTAGQSKILLVPAGQSNIHSGNTQQSTMLSVTTGQSELPSVTTGQSKITSVTTGQPKKPIRTAGQSKISSVTTGKSNARSVTAQKPKIASMTAEQSMIAPANTEHSEIPSMTAEQSEILSVIAGQSKIPSVSTEQSKICSVTAEPSQIYSCSSGQSESATIGRSEQPSVGTKQSKITSVSAVISEEPSVCEEQSLEPPLSEEQLVGTFVSEEVNVKPKEEVIEPSSCIGNSLEASASEPPSTEQSAVATVIKVKTKKGKRRGKQSQTRKQSPISKTAQMGKPAQTRKRRQKKVSTPKITTEAPVRMTRWQKMIHDYRQKEAEKEEMQAQQEKDQCEVEEEERNLEKGDEAEVKDKDMEHDNAESERNGQGGDRIEQVKERSEKMENTDDEAECSNEQVGANNRQEEDDKSEHEEDRRGQKTDKRRRATGRNGKGKARGQNVNSTKQEVDQSVQDDDKGGETERSQGKESDNSGQRKETGGQQKDNVELQDGEADEEVREELECATDQNVPKQTTKRKSRRNRPKGPVQRRKMSKRGYSAKAKVETGARDAGNVSDRPLQLDGDDSMNLDDNVTPDIEIDPESDLKAEVSADISTEAPEEAADEVVDKPMGVESAARTTMKRSPGTKKGKRNPKKKALKKVGGKKPRQWVIKKEDEEDDLLEEDLKVGLQASIDLLQRTHRVKRQATCIRVTPPVVPALRLTRRTAAWFSTDLSPSPPKPEAIVTDTEQVLGEAIVTEPSTPPALCEVVPFAGNTVDTCALISPAASAEEGASSVVLPEQAHETSSHAPPVCPIPSQKKRGRGRARVIAPGIPQEISSVPPLTQGILTPREDAGSGREVTVLEEPIKCEQEALDPSDSLPSPPPKRRRKGRQKKPKSPGVKKTSPVVKKSQSHSEPPIVSSPKPSVVSSPDLSVLSSPDSVLSSPGLPVTLDAANSAKIHIDNTESALLETLDAKRCRGRPRRRLLQSPTKTSPQAAKGIKDDLSHPILSKLRTPSNDVNSGLVPEACAQDIVRSHVETHLHNEESHVVPQSADSSLQDNVVNKPICRDKVTDAEVVDNVTASIENVASKGSNPYDWETSDESASEELVLTKVESDPPECQDITASKVVAVPSPLSTKIQKSVQPSENDSSISIVKRAESESQVSCDQDVALPSEITVAVTSPIVKPQLDEVCGTLRDGTLQQSPECHTPEHGSAISAPKDHGRTCDVSDSLIKAVSSESSFRILEVESQVPDCVNSTVAEDPPINEYLAQKSAQKDDENIGNESGQDPLENQTATFPNDQGDARVQKLGSRASDAQGVDCSQSQPECEQADKAEDESQVTKPCAPEVGAAEMLTEHKQCIEMKDNYCGKVSLEEPSGLTRGEPKRLSDAPSEMDASTQPRLAGTMSPTQTDLSSTNLTVLSEDLFDGLEHIELKHIEMPHEKAAGNVTEALEDPLLKTSKSIGEIIDELEQADLQVATNKERANSTNLLDNVQACSKYVSDTINMCSSNPPERDSTKKGPIEAPADGGPQSKPSLAGFQTEIKKQVEQKLPQHTPVSSTAGFPPLMQADVQRQQGAAQGNTSSFQGSNTMYLTAPPYRYSPYAHSYQQEAMHTADQLMGSSVSNMPHSFRDPSVHTSAGQLPGGLQDDHNTSSTLPLHHSYVHTERPSAENVIPHPNMLNSGAQAGSVPNPVSSSSLPLQQLGGVQSPTMYAGPSASTAHPIPGSSPADRHMHQQAMSAPGHQGPAGQQTNTWTLPPNGATPSHPTGMRQHASPVDAHRVGFNGTDPSMFLPRQATMMNRPVRDVSRHLAGAPGSDLASYRPSFMPASPTHVRRSGAPATYPGHQQMPRPPLDPRIPNSAFGRHRGLPRCPDVTVPSSGVQTPNMSFGPDPGVDACQQIRTPGPDQRTPTELSDPHMQKLLSDGGSSAAASPKCMMSPSGTPVSETTPTGLLPDGIPPGRKSPGVLPLTDNLPGGNPKGGMPLDEKTVADGPPIGNAQGGAPPRRNTPNERPRHEMPPNGILPHGMRPHGMPPHGMLPHGMPQHGMPPHGMLPHGMPPHGMPPHGMASHGMPLHGIPAGDIPPNRMPPSGMPPHGCHTDVISQGGIPPSGMPPYGMPQGGLEKGGMRPEGLDKHVMPPGGLNKQAMPPGSLNKDAMPPGGLDKDSMPPAERDNHGMPTGGPDKPEIPQGGLDKQGMPQSGMSPHEMPSDGMPPHGMSSHEPSLEAMPPDGLVFSGYPDDGQELIDRLQNNISEDITQCSCPGTSRDEMIEGPYYTHLGSARDLPAMRSLMEHRSGLRGSALRIEKLIFTGKEGKGSQGCPIAKWIVRRSGHEEKLLVLVRPRPGHVCETAIIVINLVCWEGVPEKRATQLYDFMVKNVATNGFETERRCGTNEQRTCMCQGLDGQSAGASFSFGCSWSMYYNGCKFARSGMQARKFRLKDEEMEPLLEEHVLNLADELAPLYKSIAPDSFKNMTAYESVAETCRLGKKPGQPFSGVTACMDFCAHSHKDIHNMNNGCTMVVTLTKHRGIGPREDEQLHVLPLYTVDSTDEFGCAKTQDHKVQTGALESLTRYKQNLLIRSAPRLSKRKRALLKAGRGTPAKRGRKPKLAGRGMGSPKGGSTPDSSPIKTPGMAQTPQRLPGHSMPGISTLLSPPRAYMRGVNTGFHGNQDWGPKPEAGETGPKNPTQYGPNWPSGQAKVQEVPLPSYAEAFKHQKAKGNGYSILKVFNKKYQGQANSNNQYQDHQQMPHHQFSQNRSNFNPQYRGTQIKSEFSAQECAKRKQPNGQHVNTSHSQTQIQKPREQQLPQYMEPAVQQQQPMTGQPQQQIGEQQHALQQQAGQPQQQLPGQPQQQQAGHPQQQLAVQQQSIQQQQQAGQPQQQLPGQPQQQLPGQPQQQQAGQPQQQLAVQQHSIQQQQQAGQPQQHQAGQQQSVQRQTGQPQPSVQQQSLNLQQQPAQAQPSMQQKTMNQQKHPSEQTVNQRSIQEHQKLQHPLQQQENTLQQQQKLHTIGQLQQQQMQHGQPQQQQVQEGQQQMHQGQPPQQQMHQGKPQQQQQSRQQQQPGQQQQAGQQSQTTQLQQKQPMNQPEVQKIPERELTMHELQELQQQKMRMHQQQQRQLMQQRQQQHKEKLRQQKLQRQQQKRLQKQQQKQQISQQPMQQGRQDKVPQQPIQEGHSQQQHIQEGQLQQQQIQQGQGQSQQQQIHQGQSQHQHMEEGKMQPQQMQQGQMQPQQMQQGQMQQQIQQRQQKQQQEKPQHQQMQHGPAQAHQSQGKTQTELTVQEHISAIAKQLEQSAATETCNVSKPNPLTKQSLKDDSVDVAHLNMQHPLTQPSRTSSQSSAHSQTQHSNMEQQPPPYHQSVGGLKHAAQEPTTHHQHHSIQHMQQQHNMMQHEQMQQQQVQMQHNPMQQQPNQFNQNQMNATGEPHQPLPSMQSWQQPNITHPGPVGHPHQMQPRFNHQFQQQQMHSQQHMSLQQQKMHQHQMQQQQQNMYQNNQRMLQNQPPQNNGQYLQQNSPYGWHQQSPYAPSTPNTPSRPASVLSTTSHHSSNPEVQRASPFPAQLDGPSTPKSLEVEMDTDRSSPLPAQLDGPVTPPPNASPAVAQAQYQAGYVNNQAQYSQYNMQNNANNMPDHIRNMQNHVNQMPNHGNNMPYHVNNMHNYVNNTHNNRMMQAQGGQHQPGYMNHMHNYNQMRHNFNPMLTMQGGSNEHHTIHPVNNRFPGHEMMPNAFSQQNHQPISYNYQGPSFPHPPMCPMPNGIPAPVPSIRAFKPPASTTKIVDGLNAIPIPDKNSNLEIEPEVTIKEVLTENSHLFEDSQLGGVGIALEHGTVLFECAKREVHATTAMKRPNRYQPTRIALVFYQHKHLNLKDHGTVEFEKKAVVWRQRREARRAEKMANQQNMMEEEFGMFSSHEGFPFEINNGLYPYMDNFPFDPMRTPEKMLSSEENSPMKGSQQNPGANFYLNQMKTPEKIVSSPENPLSKGIPQNAASQQSSAKSNTNVSLENNALKANVTGQVLMKKEGSENTMDVNATQANAIQVNTMQVNTMQANTIQANTIQANTKQANTMQADKQVSQAMEIDQPHCTDTETNKPDVCNKAHSNETSSIRKVPVVMRDSTPVAKTPSPNATNAASPVQTNQQKPSPTLMDTSVQSVKEEGKTANNGSRSGIQSPQLKPTQSRMQSPFPEQQQVQQQEKQHQQQQQKQQQQLPPQQTQQLQVQQQHAIQECGTGTPGAEQRGAPQPPCQHPNSKWQQEFHKFQQQQQSYPHDTSDPGFTQNTQSMNNSGGQFQQHGQAPGLHQGTSGSPFENSQPKPMAGVPDSRLLIAGQPNPHHQQNLPHPGQMPGQYPHNHNMYPGGPHMHLMPPSSDGQQYPPMQQQAWQQGDFSDQHPMNPDQMPPDSKYNWGNSSHNYASAPTTQTVTTKWIKPQSVIIGPYQRYM